MLTKDRHPDHMQKKARQNGALQNGHLLLYVHMLDQGSKNTPCVIIFTNSVLMQ